jgi:hypothetical protein
MKPFDEYPSAGRRLLGITPDVQGDNSLHSAWKLQSLTGQMRCAYCNGSLFGDYSCSLPRMDRVIPVAEADRLGISRLYSLDTINAVLCCSTCRDLAQGYVVPDRLRPRKLSIETFADMRDRVFAERRAFVIERSKEETPVLDYEVWGLPKAA